MISGIERNILDSPRWAPEESAVIAPAWDVAEAWESYRAVFGFARTYGAIRLEWYRLHPPLPDHDRELSRMIGKELDELERVA